METTSSTISSTTSSGEQVTGQCNFMTDKRHHLSDDSLSDLCFLRCVFKQEKEKKSTWQGWVYTIQWQYYVVSYITHNKS